jgi:hypothetical protein
MLRALIIFFIIVRWRKKIHFFGPIEKNSPKELKSLGLAFFKGPKKKIDLCRSKTQTFVPRSMVHYRRPSAPKKVFFLAPHNVKLKEIE